MREGEEERSRGQEKGTREGKEEERRAEKKEGALQARPVSREERI
jgi:hypothetical protein